MSKYERLKAHLPTLYQPEVRDTRLLNLLLKELGGNMDELSRDLTVVMQSHWFKSADKATYDNHFILGRVLAGIAPVNIHNKEDRNAIAKYPYLLDLARVGALLSIAPRQEPVAVRESVEAYRKRLLRIVNIYRNGLGTLEALRNMVTAELLENNELPLPAQQRSFSIEENAPYIGSIQTIQSIGLPLEKIGPMMRWQLSNGDSHTTVQQAVAPVLFIEGIDDTDDDDATVSPMIELFEPDSSIDPEASLVGIGIAYRDTLAANVTLKLAPAYSAFLVAGSGVLRSQVSETQVAIGDWQLVADAPTGSVTASLQTADKMMWFALDNAGTNELWRYNGSDWLQVLSAETLTPIHCLCQRQQQLLIGSDDGLLAMPLYPNSGDPFEVNPIISIPANSVFCLLRSKHGSKDSSYEGIYVASADGLDLLADNDTVSRNIIQGTAIRSVIESDIVLYFGGDIGLMQYRFKSQQYYYLSAEFESELVNDWIKFESTAEAISALDDHAFGLPAVTSLMLGGDDSLWIGTNIGLARYRARKETQAVYRNLLEGFSDLVDGAVAAIRKDEYGYIWFATSRGLLRFDGRDLARFDITENRWAALGQADSRYNEAAIFSGKPVGRGIWRFNRTLTQWETFDYVAAQWARFTAESELDAESYSDLVFVDSVKAQLGTLSVNNFSSSHEVDPSQLIMRCKPEHTRIVDGGIPCIPRAPVGESNWRYLSLEPEGLVDSSDLPWWSIEGRLVPPPQHDAAYPGRFNTFNQIPYQLGKMIYAHNPAAKIKFQWDSHKPLRVMVRLLKRDINDAIDPVIIDRVWQGIRNVKPAGVQIQLALDEQTVRGE